MNPMKLWTMTDVGLVRKDNQDAFATRQLESGCTICVVCDGMGGAGQPHRVGDLYIRVGEGPEAGYDAGAAAGGIFLRGGPG